MEGLLVLSRSLHHRTSLKTLNRFKSYVVASRYQFNASTLKPLQVTPNRLFSTNPNDKTEQQQPKTWVESTFIPDKIKPYLYLARMDKPVGTMLLFWPCCWGVALATPIGAFPDVLMMSKFLVGAFIMRGAGCTINDLWDQDFDKKVERTKTRPLASGQITTNDALKFLFLQLTGGLAVLLTFNQASILTGFASMPLVVIYPLMKRFTNWPQMILGLTFNWGCWVGYTCIHDAVNYQAILPLYLSGVCWTLVYDTIYGYQDRQDDKKIGVKSVPLTLGDHPQWPLTAISAGMFGGLLYTGYQMDYSLPFYVGTSLVWSHMLWQIWSAELDNTPNLWQRFTSNVYIGGAVTASMIAGHF